MRATTTTAAGLGAAALLLLVACGSSSSSGSGGSGDWASATSAEDGGGMDALVAAAKKEGSLNVITLPRDWAGYGDLMDAFTARYGIKITDANPDGSSADEIAAITSLKGQDRAPDVVDVGQSFALSGAGQGLYASYRVATWADIPDNEKASDGSWFNDYGGYVSIGCDASKVTTCPQTFADLDDPALAGKVALNGDPTKANAAFSAVYAAALANGGSLDDIKPGIDFFGELARGGQYVPVQATAATVESGETPVVIDWDYLNAAKKDDVDSKGGNWQVAVPSDALFAGYYAQAVSRYAPHPAAARLWEEFLYSDAGQNGFLKGFARPVRLDAMTTAGTIDPALAGNLPPVSGSVTFPTDAQTTAAKTTLTSAWSAAVSG
jgi:putative spermidine/putrescine transport system substrate-binding protein